MTAKTLFAWNLFLLFLVLASPTTLLFSEVSLGMAVMVLLFLIMLLGYYMGGYRKNRGTGRISHMLSRSTSVMSIHYRMLTLGIVSCVFSMLATWYYTGNGPLGLVTDLLSGGSIYVQYQIRFMEQDIAVFQVAKLPFLFMLALVKLNLIIQVLLAFWLLGRPRLSDYAGLWLSIFAYLYFSVARGTSFEVFELSILLYMGFVLRSQKITGNWSISTTDKIWVFLLAAVALIWYGFNLDSRGAYSVCSMAGICIDPNSFLYQLSPEIATLIFRLNAYFTFGLQFMNEFAREISSGSFSDTVSYIVPFGPVFTTLDSSVTSVCQSAIFCEYQWIPDVARFIDAMGIVVVLFVAGFLGFAGRILEYSVERGSLIAAGLLFFVILQLIAFPVGNFLFSSSANVLSLLIFLMATISPGFGRLLGKLYGVTRSYPIDIHI